MTEVSRQRRGSPEAARYAIVDKEGNVVNVSLWDGVTPWQPGEGLKAIKDEKDEAQIGGKYDGKKFLPPISK